MFPTTCALAYRMVALHAVGHVTPRKHDKNLTICHIGSLQVSDVSSVGAEDERGDRHPQAAD